MNLGRVKYLSQDKVRPSQVWFTAALWCVVTIPALFILVFIIP